MSRTTILPDGRVAFRTALFRSLPKAQAFARCVAAHTGRFEHARVHASSRSRTPAFFVTFEPAAESRKEALLAGQQDARQARADAGAFLFWQDPDRGYVYWCLSAASGETYEVTQRDCSCADYQIYGRRAGIACKHMLAWIGQKRKATIGSTGKSTPAEQTRFFCEEITRRVNEDF